MIVNSKELLIKAHKNGYAIPHFNINNLEWTRYILEECSKNSSPVILGVSISAAKYMGGYKTVVSLVENLCDYLNIEIPVVIHLDHGTSIDDCLDAINAGFTSIMYDGSKLSIEENISNVKKIEQICTEKNISLETEIGAISNTNNLFNENAYASVEDCLKMINETKIDSLAPAIGNAHGIYIEKPCLNYKLLEEINEKLNIPLVLHGASGIIDEDIKKLIKYGISKININTDLQIEWSNEVKKYLKENIKEIDPRKIIGAGEEKIKEQIKTKLILFESINKA